MTAFAANDNLEKILGSLATFSIEEGKTMNDDYPCQVSRLTRTRSCLLCGR